MTKLTYIIGFIAIIVVGRAFFSSDKKDTIIDTPAIIIEENSGEEKTNTSLDSSIDLVPQDDQTSLIDNNPPLIINEAASSQNSNWSLVIDSWPLPTTTNNDVIFFSQAPDGDRNLPRQEACEEASIVLANYFIKNKTLTKDQMRADILSLVDRQMELFGDYLHTTIEQTKQLYEDFYGWSSYIIDNPTIEDIKTALAQWYLIVAPFAGRKLWNPYYSGKGPLYHMMVLKWYDETYIYTNDVGTRRGENYRYSYQTILDANHDRADNINQWSKRMLVITE